MITSDVLIFCMRFTLVNSLAGA